MLNLAFYNVQISVQEMSAYLLDNASFVYSSITFQKTWITKKFAILNLINQLEKYWSYLLVNYSPIHLCVLP